VNGFTLNVLLAVVWALLAGEADARHFLIGFVLGFGVLALFSRTLGTGGYVRRSGAWLGFLGFFLRELTVANVGVALLALRPRPPLNPLIVGVPLRVSGDTALTLLAAVITLMPGTVALGFSADRRTLYAHAIGTASAQSARDSILRVEKYLLRLTPPSPASPEVPA
jgi:multicomponent Na+:H+ antiporter subunit E